MNIKLNIRITRTSGGDESTPFRLTIEDDDASCEIIDARIDAENFCNLLTNRQCECEAEVRPDNIGKRIEVKTEQVPAVGVWIKEEDRAAEARKAFAPFEVDGWKGCVSDLFNHHRGSGSTRNVTFTRHVPK